MHWMYEQEGQSSRNTHDEVVCTNSLHTACNSMYFGRTDAVYTKRKSALWNSALVCVSLFTKSFTHLFCWCVEAGV